MTTNELDLEYDPQEHIDRLIYEGQVLMDALYVFANRDNWVNDEDETAYTMKWMIDTPWSFAMDVIDSLKEGRVDEGEDA